VTAAWAIGAVIFGALVGSWWLRRHD